MHSRMLFWATCVGAFLGTADQLSAQLKAPLSLSVSNGVKTVQWPLVPALDSYQFSTGATVNGTVPVAPFWIRKDTTGYSFATTNNMPQQFYSLQLNQMSEDALLSANLLNRIAYGPTPDDLERVFTGPGAIGPDAYIEEQLAFESVTENEPINQYTSVVTNSATGSDPLANWVNVRVQGTFSNTNLYMYLTSPGEIYVDNVALYAGFLTNYNVSTNYVLNGDFEDPLSPSWVVTDGFSNSVRSTEYAASGANSLKIVSTTNGSTLATSIYQSVLPGLTNNQRIVLSFWYLPRPDANKLVIRLSGNGVSVTATNSASWTPMWTYVTRTGIPTSRVLYVYLEGDGDDSSDAYIDNIKLVHGMVPEQGPNLIRNGDFESPLTDIDWYRGGVSSNSHISANYAYTGNQSMHLMFSRDGSTAGSAVVQSNIQVALNVSNYTLSYWYVQHPRRRLVVRFSGDGIRSEPDRAPEGVYRRLETAHEGVNLDELRGWFCASAVGARGQLMQILLQFLENHFVTQHSKSVDYMDRFYDDGLMMNHIATAFEYREIKLWREALENPNCTFYDLLKIHAESPAQIIYLDTVGSRGDARNIANENYARELFELFAMGVDNGYDQNDIVVMSRAWTGWTVRLVDATNQFNMFAPQSTTVRVLNGNTSVSNLVGVWTSVFRSDWHGTNRAPILSVWNPNSPATNPVAIGPKTYPARFGSPWAGTSYQLVLPRRTGNIGIEDGYDVLRHLANVAFTAEYISVKLCRLFVHEHFEHGVYDYTDPNRSPEAELIRQCIVAWNTPGLDGRKGNIRSVLRTIFNSELFRSHGGSMQKVKTPLEFVASSVRALRSRNADGSFTATTDGLAIPPVLSRMGAMSLFNRADPDGYPETGAAWVSAGTLAERLRFVQSLLTARTTGSGDAGNNFADPVALLRKKLPSTSWYNASVVADYFLGILYPAEGRANLEQYKTLAVEFLNTSDTGATSSFSTLSDQNAYATRVRGMVSMLMTLQRFQEQ